MEWKARNRLARAGIYPEEELLHSLDELWHRHILPELSGSEYDFSHARIRDVAYGQISPLRRRSLHRRIAQAWEQLHSHETDAVSGVIAAHHELGDLPVQAISYYPRAARFAKNAYLEAADSLHHALALLQTLRDGEARL